MFLYELIGLLICHGVVVVAIFSDQGESSISQLRQVRVVAVVDGPEGGRFIRRELHHGAEYLDFLRFDVNSHEIDVGLNVAFLIV